MKIKTLALFMLLNYMAAAQKEIGMNHHNHTHGEIRFSTAPISISGEHLHNKGDFMVSYKGMFMTMDELVDGNTIQSDDEVYSKGYMMSPQSMEMQMHMLGLMYSPSAKITLMAMTSYITKNMDMSAHGMSRDFSTKSSGFGDFSIMALMKIVNKKRLKLHANIGASLPTGGITQTDDNPVGEAVQLPYNMQLGSGSFDLKLGVTITGSLGKIDWGVQPKSTTRLNESNKNYKLGNQYGTNLWMAYKVNSWFNFSVSTKGLVSESISGVNSDLNPMMSPLTNIENSGGTYVDGGLGVNFNIYNGFLSGTKVALEGRIPLYYNTNGVQMITKNSIHFGVQYSF